MAVLAAILFLTCSVIFVDLHYTNQRLKKLRKEFDEMRQRLGR